MTSQISETGSPDLPPNVARAAGARNWLSRNAGQPFLPILFLGIWLSVLGPWWSAYEFGPDEGINLMKAALVARGHGIYSEIWNDQPPVLTFVLAALQFIWPNDVGAARAVILGFAGLLLASLFRLVRRSEGLAGAWIAMIVLCGSSLFQWVSVSVFVGLPAVALAVAAIDQGQLGGLEGKTRKIVIAGILFALSLQTKLFTLILLPSLICAVLITSNASGGWRNARSRAAAVTWLLFSIALTFLFIAILTREPIIDQLIMTHIVSSRAGHYALQTGWDYLWTLLSRDFALVAMGSAGVLATLIRPYGARLIPLVACAVAVLVLSQHRPARDHQMLIILVPLAWLSAIAFKDALNLIGSSIRWKSNRWIEGIAFGAVLLGTVSYAPFRAAANVHNADDDAVISALKNNARGDPWVITDRLMDAFRSGLLVPPEMAVYSVKRVAGGYLDPTFVVSVLKKRDPAQVLFRRFQLDPQIAAYLTAAGYDRLPGSGKWQHFVRR